MTAYHCSNEDSDTGVRYYAHTRARCKIHHTIHTLTQPMNLPLSAIIITLNEERNIQQCLDSVHFCDEIIVVDSGSNDSTVKIATEFGATVITQDWLGYGPQKQFAVEQANNDWVLCIDADEVISPPLKNSIMAIDFLTRSPIAYKMPRKNHFLGRALHHGEGYPDLSLRLFHRSNSRWSTDKVHEGVITDNSKIKTLTGDLLHFSEETLSHYINKQNQYTLLQAQALFAQGKYCDPSKCFTSPLIRFVKFYFFRLGFLDGAAGFIHITIGCFNAFCKYAKLLELQRHSQEHQRVKND